MGLASGDFYCPSFLLDSQFRLVKDVPGKIFTLFLSDYGAGLKNVCKQTQQIWAGGREGVLGRKDSP